METLVKSNVVSDITKQLDVMTALVAIRAQQTKSANAIGKGKQDKEEDKEEVIDELLHLKNEREHVRKTAAVRN